MYYHELDIKVACFDVGVIQASTVINITEFVLVVINLFLLPLFVHVTGRLTIHVNLKCIIGSLCYNYIFYLLNRIFFLTIQLDILDVPDNSKQIVSIIYNFVNVYFFQTYLYSQCSICVERFTATLFLRDYETNKRAFISRTAVILTCVLSVSGSTVYVFVFPRQMKLVLAVFALANSIIGATIMLKLERRNKRLLAEFSASRKNVEVPYSLSLRFQLDENIRSTQLIRNLFLLFGVANIILAPVYAATMKSEKAGSSCSQKIMEAILHFIIVISATEVPFVALSSHQQYRELAKNVPLFGYFCRIMNKKKNVYNRDEAIFVFQKNVEATSYEVRQRSKYICGTEPYLFYSDIECSLHPVCPNGGMRLQVGCTNDFQCQGIRFDSRCINSCCCTLPRLLETTTPVRLRDNSSPSNCMSILLISVVTTFLYLAI